jgi:hypothetical protein
MRKGTIALFVALAFMCSLFVGMSYAAKPPAKDLTLKGATKGAVTFSHAKHKMSCKECHHKGEPTQKCESCHKAAAEGKTPSLKEAFHKNCQGCHKAQKKGPQTCNDCHKK